MKLYHEQCRRKKNGFQRYNGWVFPQLQWLKSLPPKAEIQWLVKHVLDPCRSTCPNAFLRETRGDV